MAKQKNVMNKEGYEKLLQELHDLEKVQLPAVLEQIKEARAEGDLSENSDYHAAQDKQALLKHRVSKLKDMLDGVEIVQDESSSRDSVGYGSVVTVDIEDGDSHTFEIVGSSEIDIDADPMKISLDSPIGAAIDGAKKGDTVLVRLLSGKKNLTIKKVV